MSAWTTTNGGGDCGLVTTKTLLIMTSTEGIYADPKDPKTLIRDVLAKTPEERSANSANYRRTVWLRPARARKRRGVSWNMRRPEFDAQYHCDDRSRPSPDQRFGGGAACPCTRIEGGS